MLLWNRAENDKIWIGTWKNKNFHEIIKLQPQECQGPISEKVLSSKQILSTQKTMVAVVITGS